jgi:lysylphosphatidylglycerol synthetase-like protein (DUF2156 family)
MNALFRWAMRHGARIVFAVALLQLAAGLVLPLATLISVTGHMARDHDYSPAGNMDTLLQMSQIFYSLSSFALLLVGAVIIDRADRFLILRERREAE